MTEPTKTKTSSALLNVYILAGIGYACLLGWELSAIFSPALVLLSFCDMQEAIALRIVSVFTLAVSFAFFFRKQDWVLDNRNRLFAVGSIFALLAVINTAVNLVFEGIPLIVSILVWALFGIAQASIMMYWCIFFSLIPTRRTAATIVLGSLGGTVLFALVNASGSSLAGLAQIALLIVGSAVMVAFLLMRLPSECILPVKEYRRSTLLTIPAILSVVCHGAVFGFMSIMMCLMGPIPVLICGLSGILGLLFISLWGYLGPRIEIDTGIVQRVSLPIIMTGLLLFPFFGDVGKVVCGCLVNIALAHASVVAWYTVSIDNAEFQLHPVDRFSMRQATTWVGFFCGSIGAYLLVFHLDPSDRTFSLIVVIFALIVVGVFSLYGGDESKTKKRLDDILTASGADEAVEETDDYQVNDFRKGCERIIATYELTPREGEVFFLLAKGRNAEYISTQLVVSIATVRSHIYHIYRKLGINSQQRLMTIVDDEVDEA